MLILDGSAIAGRETLAISVGILAENGFRTIVDWGTISKKPLIGSGDLSNKTQGEAWDHRDDGRPSLRSASR